MNCVMRYVHTSSKSQLNYHANTGSIDSIRHLNLSEKHNINKLVNLCMIHGKKSQSQHIISNTLNHLSSYGDVVDFITTAIDNVKPILEVKKIRISGNTQLVPAIIPKHRQQTLAIRWLLEAAAKRRNTKRNMSLAQCLSLEILDAFHKVGVVRQKRDELHKLAEANRAFAHYRWW